jgi:amino acid transporter
LWDATSIVVGVVIGAGIYEAPSSIFQNVSGPQDVLAVWVLGGVVSLIGALCYAELASTYPRSSGEYVYLTRAYGTGLGVLYAWAQLAVLRTGAGIAAMAYVFAHYAATVWDFGPAAPIGYAAGAILILTLINVLGVQEGKWTQNGLTAAKVLGLGAIAVVGLCWASPGPQTNAPSPGMAEGSFALAMVFVFYTYDGWNEAVFVTREVRDRRRNMPLALLIGTGLVTTVYVLVNVAYLAGLGFETARASALPIPAAVLSLALGTWGAGAMSLLVMLSALGALNGMILTGSRIYPELANDHPVFAGLGRWDPRLGTPVRSLVLQALLSIGMVAGVGVWWQGRSGFDALVKMTAPVFWLFFLLVGLSLLVLRFRDRDIERPFRVPLYPFLPLIFCTWCGYMLYGSINYAQREALVGLGVLLAGVPLLLVPRKRTPG